MKIILLERYTPGRTKECRAKARCRMCEVSNVTVGVEEFDYVK